MTLTELENAEKRMLQQWRELIRAEEEGASLEVLEQMYDTYILLAEEHNGCFEEYQREQQGKQEKEDEEAGETRHAAAQKSRRTRRAVSVHEDEEQVKLAS